jgi:hypothetical protein
METFKILLPSGYDVKDINNDNIDINVVLQDGGVYFATFFTILNIQTLMMNDGSPYFWSTDMIILKDLNIETIKKTVSKIIDDELLEVSFSKIGMIERIYSETISFEELKASI